MLKVLFLILAVLSYLKNANLVIKLVKVQKNRLGPQLNNIFGRTAGELPGIKYSKAMIKAGEEGLVWNNETLNTFIENPKGLVPKTRMSFRGLKNDEDRKNLLSYLSEFSKNKTQNDTLVEFLGENHFGIDSLFYQSRATQNTVNIYLVNV